MENLLSLLRSLEEGQVSLLGVLGGAPGTCGLEATQLWGQAVDFPDPGSLVSVNPGRGAGRTDFSGDLLGEGLHGQSPWEPHQWLCLGKKGQTFGS